jgi:hypothetical protein
MFNFVHPMMRMVMCMPRAFAHVRYRVHGRGCVPAQPLVVTRS